MPTLPQEDRPTRRPVKRAAPRTTTTPLTRRRASGGTMTADGASPLAHSVARQTGRAPQFAGGTGFYDSPTNRAIWEFNTANATPQLPAGIGGGSGGSGGSGGGGGGGGGGPTDDGGMGAFLTTLINSGAMAPAQQQYVRDGGMYDKVGTAVAADQANAAGAYDRLDGVLAGFKNPYDGLQAQTAGGVDSSLQRYLASQGGDGRGLAAEGALTEAQGQQQTAAAQQLLSILGANEQAGQNSRLTQSGMGRANANYQLGAQQTGMNAALDRQEAARKAQIEAQNFQLTQQAQAAKLQMITQIAQLAAQFGQPMPDIMALLGQSAPVEGVRTASAPTSLQGVI